MPNIAEIFNKKIYIFSPKRRAIHYCYYGEYVFEIEEITFIKNLNDIKEKNYTLFVDQTLLKEFLNFKYVNNNIKVFILLWNGNFDYLKHIEDLKKIGHIYKNFKMISLDNFSHKSENILSLNNFKLTNKNVLKKINGISLITKIKYLYPTIYSVYNFLRYIIISKNFLFVRKIIFVGRGDYFDTIDSIKVIHRLGNKDTKKFSKIFLDKFKSQKFIHNTSFKEILNDINFKNLDFHEKYYISSTLIRYFLINHLNKFNSFYHKNNNKYPLDFLNSNIYKNLIQLELGSKVGNSEIYSRRLMLNKFYKQSLIKINFFDNDVNYSRNELFDKRLLIIDDFLNEFYNFKDFKISSKNLAKKLNDLNINYLRT
jgi:hypothetical protein